MKQVFKTLVITTLVFLATLWAGEASEPVSSSIEPSGMVKAQEGSLPLADDYGSLVNAPVQVPALVPGQSSRQLAPTKLRTSLMRAQLLRRSVNRLSINTYTPISTTGRLIVERMSSPLRCWRAVTFYVFELCRLLC